MIKFQLLMLSSQLGSSLSRNSCLTEKIAVCSLCWSKNCQKRGKTKTLVEMNETGVEEQWTGFCTIVEVDPTKIWYSACATCEKPLPVDDNSNVAGGSCAPPAPSCRFCSRNAFILGKRAPKRLYCLLFSIATDERVKVVICFDKTARFLFGCTADEFFCFCKRYPSAAETSCKILEGEIFWMSLNSRKNGNAEHLRVAFLYPARSSYCTVMERLKKIYVADK